MGTMRPRLTLRHMSDVWAPFLSPLVKEMKWNFRPFRPSPNRKQRDQSKRHRDEPEIKPRARAGAAGIVRHLKELVTKISRTKSAGVLLLRVHGWRWSNVAYPHAAAIKLNYHTVWGIDGTFVPRLSPDVTRPIDPRS